MKFQEKVRWGEGGNLLTTPPAKEDGSFLLYQEQYN